MNNKDAKVASSSGSPSETENNQPAETKSQVALFATSAAELDVRTLLRRMLAALDQCDSETYWHSFELFLKLHSDATKPEKSANDQAQVRR